MRCSIIIILILSLTFIMYIFKKGYPEHGWFKKILHDKFEIHVPDLKNWLDYDEDKKIVYSACKYCNEELIYYDICKYLVNNNPEKIPDSINDSYCRECVLKNYTKNRNCCPLKCGQMSTCQTCEKDWSNE